MKLLGIDEAGRGSVIGPLIICGVSIENERVKYLERLKLKDSKRISPKRRIVLSRKIHKIADCHMVNFYPKDIDLLRSKGVNLNQIEKIGFNRIISDADAATCIIDSIDVKPERLKMELEIIHPKLKVVAEHGADDRYPLVSAASIVAKVERDMEIQKLQKQYKEIGSGYPSDPRTINFLRSIPNGDMPECVRKSWVTLERIK